jgi:hypothetical protein
MIDADGSMDPVEIDYFVEKLRGGYDLVKGSRFLPGAGTADMTLVRDLGHRVLLGFSNFLYGTSWTDLCYGFAAFRRDAFTDLALTADGFEIEAQLFLRAERTGLRIAEAPSFEAPRRTGTSNLNTFRDGWRVLGTILAERLRPTRPAAVSDPFANRESGHGVPDRASASRSSRRAARAGRAQRRTESARSAALSRPGPSRRGVGERLTGSATTARKSQLD